MNRILLVHTTRVSLPLLISFGQNAVGFLISQAHYALFHGLSVKFSLSGVGVDDSSNKPVG